MLLVLELSVRGVGPLCTEADSTPLIQPSNALTVGGEILKGGTS